MSFEGYINQNDDTQNTIITNIQNLQNIELDLFDSLEKGIVSNSLNFEDKTKLTDQINKISDMRVNLFTNLNKINQHYQGDVLKSGDVISNQLDALNIIENELNESKIRFKIIEEDKNNKLRQVEINTYYGEKYADHTTIMKTIIFFCIPIIIFTILTNMNILPNSLYSVLIIITSIWAIIAIGTKIIYAMSHDNMNYQEYVWGSNQPPTTPSIDTSNETGTNPWFSVGSTCVAQECCDDGFTYVPSPTNKCVANDKLPAGVLPYINTTWIW